MLRQTTAVMEWLGAAYGQNRSRNGQLEPWLGDSKEG